MDITDSGPQATAAPRRHHRRLSSFAEDDVPVSVQTPKQQQGLFLRIMSPSHQLSSSDTAKSPINQFFTPRHLVSRNRVQSKRTAASRTQGKSGFMSRRIDTTVAAGETNTRPTTGKRLLKLGRQSQSLSRFALPTPRLGRHGTMQSKDAFFGEGAFTPGYVGELNNLDSFGKIPFRYRLKKFLATSFTGKAKHILHKLINWLSATVTAGKNMAFSLSKATDHHQQ
jgi:hypothetical protein